MATTPTTPTPTPELKPARTFANHQETTIEAVEMKTRLVSTRLREATSDKLAAKIEATKIEGTPAKKVLKALKRAGLKLAYRASVLVELVTALVQLPFVMLASFALLVATKTSKAKDFMTVQGKDMISALTRLVFVKNTSEEETPAQKKASLAGSGSGGGGTDATRSPSPTRSDDQEEE